MVTDPAAIGVALASVPTMGDIRWGPTTPGLARDVRPVPARLPVNSQTLGTWETIGHIPSVTVVLESRVQIKS